MKSQICGWIAVLAASMATTAWAGYADDRHNGRPIVLFAKVVEHRQNEGEIVVACFCNQGIRNAVDDGRAGQLLKADARGCRRARTFRFGLLDGIRRSDRRRSVDI